MMKLEYGMVPRNHKMLHTDAIDNRITFFSWLV